MPRILQYDAPALGLQPSDEGVRATAAAGARIGRNFDQLATSAATVGNEFAKDMGAAVKDVGQVAVEYTGRKNRADLAAASTNAFAAADKDWNDSVARAVKEGRADDPSLITDFNQRIESNFEKLRDAAWTEEGQKFAETRIAEMRQHFAVKTAGDLSSLAAIDIKNKVDTVINNSTNTAFTDPTSIPSLLQMGDTSIDAFVGASPNLTGVAAAKVKTELGQHLRERIVEAGIMGAAAKAADPESAVRALGERYKNLIPGDRLKIIEQNAKQQMRARVDDMERAERLRETRERRVSNARLDQYYIPRLYSDDPDAQAQVSAREIVNDTNLTRLDKEHALGLIRRATKPETDARISAQTSTQIFRMMNEPNADYEKVRAAIFAARSKDPGTPGSLSKADHADLMKNLEDVKTPAGQALAADRGEFFKRYAPTIDLTMTDEKSMTFGRHSALGAQKMYEAEKAARRAEEQLKKQGRDPHALYDPASPDFFGKPANLSRFQVTMQQAAEFQKQQQQQASQPRNPGGQGEKVLGVEVIDLPPGLSPADAMKRYRSGTRIRLYDGRIGTVP